jgi:hypothetical protein
MFGRGQGVEKGVGWSSHEGGGPGVGWSSGAVIIEGEGAWSGVVKSNLADLRSLLYS